MRLDEMERWVGAAIRSLRMSVEEIRRARGRLAAIWRPETPWPIDSPQRRYPLQSKLATGDLCDVYLAASAGERFVVKIPRLAGGAADSVMEKEHRVLRQLAAGDAHYRRYFPQPVETFIDAEEGLRCHVMRWEEGLVSAEQIRAKHPGGLEGRHIGWMFKRVLEALGYAHRQGWINGAVLPPHLLFHTENHGLRLIGWLHAARVGQPLTALPKRFQDWYPREARRAALPATDLFLAARSMIWLAGGDPASGVMPDAIPRPMQLFLRGCLLESPRMRPQDAWRLHEEFSELLESLYGAPKFVTLSMR